MATEKELTAFVERVAKQASLRGSHRATFVAVRPLIEGALAAGYSMKTTWEALGAEGQLTMSYETFRAHCREAGLGRVARRPGGDRAQAEGQAFARSAPPLAGPRERPDDRRRTFRHSAVPSTKKIYG